MKIYVCGWRLSLVTALQSALVLVLVAICCLGCIEEVLEAWIYWNANSFYHLHRTLLADSCVTMHNSWNSLALLCCVLHLLYIFFSVFYFIFINCSYWTFKDVFTLLCSWSAPDWHKHVKSWSSINLGFAELKRYSVSMIWLDASIWFIFCRQGYKNTPIKVS